MFEDFRQQAEQANFLDEDLEEGLQAEAAPAQHGYFLGLTPAQRFILALMLLFMTIVVGVLFLLVTSKITLPFMS
jgi:hypothetical protein